MVGNQKQRKSWKERAEILCELWPGESEEEGSGNIWEKMGSDPDKSKYFLKSGKLQS